jgi:hypothetical protein
LNQGRPICKFSVKAQEKEVFFDGSKDEGCDVGGGLGAQT